MTSANKKLTKLTEFKIENRIIRAAEYKGKRLILFQSKESPSQWHVEYGDLAFIIGLNRHDQPYFVRPNATWFVIEDLSLFSELFLLFDPSMFSPSLGDF